MTQRERESIAGQSSAVDSDPNSFFFGDEDPGYPADGGEAGGDGAAYPLTRADRRRDERLQHTGRRRRSRRGIWFVLLVLVIVAAVAAVVVPRVVDYFSTPDYSGNGYGVVTVTIPSGDGIKDIGNLLHDKDVVKSAKAFTDAAAGQSIQQGTYELRHHMSGKAAVAALLNPTSQVQAGKVVVPEGATSLDVYQRLVARFGQSSAAAIKKALASPVALNVPSSYTAASGQAPASVEGFLYPATYTFDPSESATDALTDMVLRFVKQDRDSGFAADARAVHLSPYQALIVASIAQSEAKYADDMPKVVRTILNRIEKHQPLQFDSTSSYACKLAGTPADKCVYAKVDSPYNTYTHTGLPPTPIDNPGEAALDAAVKPASGSWLFFVNIDAAGHLGFFTNAKDFEKARQKCATNHWGCAS